MMIPLEPKQIYDYLVLNFYRPTVLPSQQEADKYKKALHSLLMDGHIGTFSLYPGYGKNKPTLMNSFSWEGTPQGFGFWKELHQKIVDTAGYDKNIMLVLTDEQKVPYMQAIEMVKPIQKKTYKFKIHPEASVSEDTREII